MLNEKDIGNEVKVVYLDGTRFRGTVEDVTGSDAIIKTLTEGRKIVYFHLISTVTRVGDFS